jgi:hypothetical protein
MRKLNERKTGLQVKGEGSVRGWHAECFMGRQRRDNDLVRLNLQIEKNYTSNFCDHVSGDL